jgi:drug/metabolite transporter (DMT)-like permease
MMTNLRHLGFFLALGMFWGISPSLYGHWGDIGMPVSHVLMMTGFGVGLMLVLLARFQGIDWWGGRRLQLFGAGCAGLLAVSFGMGLVFARHVPPTELAIMISTSPIVNYLVALLTRRENAAPRRLMAILLGFTSTAILVLTREGMLQGSVSWWLVASFSLPFLYAAYNLFAADYWPEGVHPTAAGAAESIWLGLIALPFFVLLAPPGATGQPPVWAYWTILFACGMWTIERIAFFTLIREKGAVYTVQAIYLSSPAAVLIATALHGGADLWLFAALAILMAALYFNNTGAAAAPQARDSAAPTG